MPVVDDVIIGVDPHKLSATIEVVNRRGLLVGSGRFSTDRAGYVEMRRYVAVWPTRLWAVEGSGGAGRPLAQRLLEAGEPVVDVPAKLAARAWLFDTGHNRKTDALDAHSIAMVAVRTANLRQLSTDPSLEALPLPGPHPKRYPRPHQAGRRQPESTSNQPIDTEGSQIVRLISGDWESHRVPDSSTGMLARRPHGSVGVHHSPHRSVDDCQMRLALGLDPSGRALRIGARQRFP